MLFRGCDWVDVGVGVGGMETWAIFVYKIYLCYIIYIYIGLYKNILNECYLVIIIYIFRLNWITCWYQ
jgi:hypothetical protein